MSWRVASSLLAVGLLLVALNGPVRAESVVIQPDGAVGKDTYAYQQYPTTNFGNTYLRVYAGGGWLMYPFIQFDLPDIPSGAMFESAELSLFNYQIARPWLGDAWVSVYGVTGPWIEGNGGTDDNPPGELIWNNRPADDGIAYDTVLFDMGGVTEQVPIYPNVWKTWDVTQLVDTWYQGTSTNHGFVLKQVPPNTVIQLPYFRSSDYGTAAYRPKLEVTWIPEPATLVLLASGGLLLLLVGRRRKR